MKPMVFRTLITEPEANIIILCLVQYKTEWFAPNVFILKRSSLYIFNFDKSSQTPKSQTTLWAGGGGYRQLPPIDDSKTKDAKMLCWFVGPTQNVFHDTT